MPDQAVERQLLRARVDTAFVSAERDAARTEVERLRGVLLAASGVVERSDHADTCGSELSPEQGYPCSCWKADVGVALTGA